MKPALKKSERASRTRWLYMIVFSFVAVFTLGVVYFVYQPKQAAIASSGISSAYATVNNWMHERNHQIHQNIVKVKQLAVNNKAPHQEIHFEFYTALPNMRVTVPDVDKRDATVRAVAVTSAPSDAPSLSQAVFAKKTQNPAAIFDAGKLQNALREEFKAKIINQQYVIQMGVFKNVAGAEKFRQTCDSEGFTARVVKIAMAKGSGYSVQAGPFDSKNQAILVQRQLQKKSVNGIIRKI